MLAMIGTIMIVRIRPAVNRPVPVAVGAPKIGMKPRCSCSHGSRWCARNGPSTRMPQRPRTTLGIAASISTSEPTMPRTPPRRELAQPEGDRDRERGGDDERDQRADRGAVDERQRAEDLLDGIPGLVGDEAEPVLLDRRPGEIEDLPEDRAEQDDRGKRRRKRDLRAGRRRRCGRRGDGARRAGSRARDGTHRNGNPKPALPPWIGRHQPVTTRSPCVCPPLLRAGACSPRSIQRRTQRRGGTT